MLHMALTSFRQQQAGPWHSSPPPSLPFSRHSVTHTYRKGSTGPVTGREVTRWLGDTNSKPPRRL